MPFRSAQRGVTAATVVPSPVPETPPMTTTAPAQDVGRGVRLRYPSRTFTTGEVSEFLSAVGAAWDACLYLTQVARLHYRHAPIVWDLRDHRPDDAAPTVVEPEPALAMRQM